MSHQFSVVIPLYNKERFIGAALDSVMNQSLVPIEVVVVDDGSSDGGPALAASHPVGAIVVTQPNQGPGVARATGVKVAKGEWVAFLDADDFWLPDHLAELGRLIACAPSAGLLATSHVRRHIEDPVGPAWRPQQPTLARRRLVDYFAAAAHDIGVVCSSTAAVRRDALPPIELFPREFKGEDLALWALVALQHPVAVSNRVTAVYVQETGGIMDQSAQSSDVPAIVVSDLRALAPSCAIVEDAIDNGGHSVTTASLNKYQNGFILRSVWFALVHEQPLLAKKLATLRHGRSNVVHAVVLRFVKLMPPSVTLRFFRLFRSATRR